MSQQPTNEIHIDRLALDGDGVGRLSGPGKHAGEVAFIPYTLPDEDVRCRQLYQKKNHSRWAPIAILKASPDRIHPKCPYHFQPGRRDAPCGGCNWQHMTNAVQLRHKTQLVRETLERIGGFANPPVQEAVASPAEWRYRNKVQVPFGQIRNRLVAGFFAPGSHEIVNFEDCPVQPEPSVAIVRFVREFAIENRWHPYEEDAGRGWIRHLLVRMNAKGEALVALVTKNGTFPQREKFISELRRRFPFVIGLHQNVQPARTNVILGPQWIKLGGAEYIEETMLGLKVSYGIGSFFQVNTPAAEKLYQLAVDGLEADASTDVLDVYCGVGVMTLLAARRCRSALGVESVRQATEDADANARANGIRNASFLAARAEEALGGRTSRVEALATGRLRVLVDPPRAGCEAAVIDGLRRLAPERIVYVSCHPATLARDLKLLSPAYDLLSVTPVDLFPQTAHIESVSVLRRKS